MDLQQEVSTLEPYDPGDFKQAVNFMPASPFCITRVFQHKEETFSTNRFQLLNQLAKVGWKPHVQKIVEVLKNVRGDKPGQVWISDTLSTDMNFSLPAGMFPPEDTVQVFFIGECLQCFVLTLYNVQKKKDEPHGQKEQIHEFTVSTIKRLKSGLLDFCHDEFTILPCTIDIQDLSCDSLLQELNKMEYRRQQYYGGPIRLRTIVFNNLTKAALLLQGTSCVPFYLSSSPEDQMNTREWLLLLDQTWRNIVHLLIQHLTHGKFNFKSVSIPLNLTWKIKVAVVEAAQRVARREDIDIKSKNEHIKTCVRHVNEQTHSNAIILEADTTEIAVSSTTWKISLSEDGRALECGRNTGDQHGPSLKPEIPQERVAATGSGERSQQHDDVGPGLSDSEATERCCACTRNSMCKTRKCHCKRNEVSCNDSCTKKCTNKSQEKTVPQILGKTEREPPAGRTEVPACPTCRQQFGHSVVKTFVSEIDIEDLLHSANHKIEFKKLFCALLNRQKATGVIFHVTDCRIVDRFLSHVKDMFMSLVPDGSGYHDTFDSGIIDAQHVVVRVKSSADNKSCILSTIDFHTCFSLDKGLDRKPTHLLMQTLLKKDNHESYTEQTLPKKDDFIVDQEVLIEGEIPFTENVYRQAKGSEEGAQGSEPRKWKDKLGEYISAFSKVPGGGTIYFGVNKITERKLFTRFICKGVHLDEEQKDSWTRFCHEKMKKLLWVAHNQTRSTPGIEVDFIRPKNASGGCCVIKVTVKQFKGVGFLRKDGPESYILDENNKPTEVKPWAEWARLSNCEDLVVVSAD